MGNTLIAAILVMLVVTVLLAILLVWIKNALMPSGSVKVSINNGSKELEVSPGGDLMHTLADNGIFLPSACGGKANCGQCKLQVLDGGGTILPTETGFFSRKQIKEGWRLGCQVKVKDNLQIAVPESALSVKKLECEVISNDNVATFIKEFTVRLPEGEHIDFKSGEYIQIDIPEYEADFSDMGVAPIYMGDWEKYGITSLKYKNTEPTIRAYSMASYPAAEVQEHRAHDPRLLHGLVSGREGRHQAECAYRDPAVRPHPAEGRVQVRSGRPSGHRLHLRVLPQAG